MSVDFAETKIYDEIVKRIKDLQGRVAVLVNNVGMMDSFPKEFADISNPDRNSQVLTCNTMSVVKMCEIVLPIMKEQKFGVVINVSSGMAVYSFPYFALYSATKAFISSFTTSIAMEYEGYGIIIQDLKPNLVETNMSKNLHEEMYAVKADSFVRYALNSVGKEMHSTAHPKHKFLNAMSVFTFMMLPEYIAKFILKPMLKNMGAKARNQAKNH